MDHINSLVKCAFDARKNAYAPYSGFKVGAAIITSDNQIYSGFNIECASYSPSNCAERTALFRAVYEGHRKFKSIAVVGGKEDENTTLSDYCPPCGVCRQALREFCNPESFEIVLAKDAKNINDYKIFTLAQLLPYSFGPENLE